ncbi:hypothetical protein XP56_04160 [Xanthomonas perforans]|nr:hypothetical protein XP56_04160 [Xanthomonas perforans]
MEMVGHTYAELNTLDGRLDRSGAYRALGIAFQVAMDVSSNRRIWFVVVIDDITWMCFYVVPLLIFAWPVMVRRATTLPKELAEKLCCCDLSKFCSILILR